MINKTTNHLLLLLIIPPSIIPLTQSHVPSYLPHFCSASSIFFQIDGGLYCYTALRNARVWNAEYSRHQSTKASKPTNQKYLRLVEVPRTESVVVEVVSAILTCGYEVGVLEGVLPAVRGPVAT